MAYRIIDLTISLQDGGEILLHLDSLLEKNHLPWADPDDWGAMFTCVDTLPGNQPPSGVILTAGCAKGWFTPVGSLTNDALQQIGKELFNTALAKGIGVELHRLIAASRSDKPLINLRFKENEGYVQAYPWELVHDKDNFLFGSREAQIVRCVNVERAPKKLTPLHQLNILLVDPRPNLPAGYARLPRLDRNVFNELQESNAEDLNVMTLDGVKGKNTSQKIVRKLNFSGGTQIIHIDTHGGYGWLCNCGKLHLETTAACECGKKKEENGPAQGYLAFEKDEGKTEWISGKQLATLLISLNISMVVLSACKSGLVGRGNPFNSVAGALVHFGIPAVIAMQYSVQATAVSDFAYAFYEDLAKSKRPWIEALAYARTMLRACKEDHWYRPVLYWNPKAGKLERMYFNRAIPRSSEMKKVDQWSADLHSKRQVRQILRLTAPDGQGKSTFLREIQAKYRKDAFTFLIPATHYFREDSFDRAFPQIVDDLKQAVESRFPGSPRLEKDTRPGTGLNKLASFLNKNAKRVMVLIDDFDSIPLPDRKLFNQYIVEPLLGFQNIGIIQTAEFQPPREEDNYSLDLRPDDLELTPPQENDIAKALGEVEASYADEIFNWTGGNPRAAYRIIKDLDPSGKTPQKKENLLRSLYEDDEKLEDLLGQDKTSRNIVSILSVLRQFDNQVAGKLVPAAMNNIMGEDYPGALSALQVVGLVHSLGSRVSWLDGKYCIHGAIAINHLNYLRYVEPRRFKALHMAALECYQALLTKPENQQPRRLLEYLIEVFYHSQALIELRTDYKKSQRAKLMEEALAAYWRTIPFGVNKLIVLAEIQQKLSIDPNLGWLAKSEILQRLFRSNIA